MRRFDGISGKPLLIWLVGIWMIALPIGACSLSAGIGASQPTMGVFATATVAPTPTPNLVIYQDSLNGSTKDQWANDSNCFFGSGGYHINAAFICYAPTDKVGDAVTTVSVTQISGPTTYPYGLVIRRVSPGNYYEFLIDANGKWLFDKVVNGTTTDIVKFTPNPAIIAGLNQANTLSVQAKGSHFVFSINGTQVGTADDSTFPSGETGLSGNDNIEVVYTNLIISNVK